MFQNCIKQAWNTAIGILFNVPRDTHRYLIESISQCLHVKTMLQSRCVSFYDTIEASSNLCISFLSNLCKNDLDTVLGRNLFSIANDCSVNLSDLSKMLVKKQMKYFDVSLGHARKVPVLQELLKVMLHRLYATSSILNFRPTNFLTYCYIRPTTAVGRLHILSF